MYSKMVASQVDEDIVWYPIVMIGKFVRELHRLTTYVNITFDGDCLNILYIINEQFRIQAERKYNPRNIAYISKNDGRFNNDVNHCRDTIINANGLIQLSRDRYTQEQLDNINKFLLKKSLTHPKKLITLLKTSCCSQYCLYDLDDKIPF